MGQCSEQKRNLLGRASAKQSTGCSLEAPKYHRKKGYVLSKPSTEKMSSEISTPCSMSVLLKCPYGATRSSRARHGGPVGGLRRSNDGHPVTWPQLASHARTATHNHRFGTQVFHPLLRSLLFLRRLDGLIHTPLSARSYPL